MPLAPERPGHQDDGHQQPRAHEDQVRGTATVGPGRIEAHPAIISGLSAISAISVISAISAISGLSAISAISARSGEGTRGRSRARHAVAAGWLWLGLAVAGCASEGVPEVPLDADGQRDPVLVTGRRVYTERCANCHGNAGGGGQGRALADGEAVRRFPDISDQIAVVADGTGTMPAFSEVLSDREIEAVTRFTREVLR